MQQQEVKYSDGETNYIGQLFYDDAVDGKQPCVLLFHAMEGMNRVTMDNAKCLVRVGYAAFVVDMYGEGKDCTTMDECMAALMPLLENRELTRARAMLGFETARELDVVDANKMAAIGFCLGGLCGLDLARSGADIKAMVSAHGVLMKPENIPNETITAKVLALHGYDDPQISAEQLADFKKEMNDADVDWQMLYFGHTKHAFTDPDAALIGAPEMGRVYNEVACERTWNYAAQLFAEVLG
tara:strand:+ start:112426 stop:113148 length:723 start_codon:yes stop_codon:yes gene_type:complete